MASINELKKKIKGVKSTKQITKAMKMIAAMRLLRAQKKYRDTNYYWEKESDLLSLLGSDPDIDPNGAGKFLKTALSGKNNAKSIYVVVSADRGLCGNFNNAVISKAAAAVNSDNSAYSVILVGRKVCDREKLFQCSRKFKHTDFFADISLENINSIFNSIVSMVENESVERVFVVYNGFETLIKFKTNVTQLLPLDMKTLKTKAKYAPYGYEPGINPLFEHALKEYLSSFLVKVFYESYYSELSARINSMDNATRNADEMIEVLTLDMNKVRQANITKELSDIIGSTEGMK